MLVDHDRIVESLDLWHSGQTHDTVVRPKTIWREFRVTLGEMSATSKKRCRVNRELQDLTDKAGQSCEGQLTRCSQTTERFLSCARGAAETEQQEKPKFLRSHTRALSVFWYVLCKLWSYSVKEKYLNVAYLSYKMKRIKMIKIDKPFYKI